VLNESTLLTWTLWVTQLSRPAGPALAELEGLLLHRPEEILSPNDFASLDQLSGTLLAFTSRYNQTASPLNWKYTTSDLERHLAAIPVTPADQHSLPMAA
jgi:hypothetical protein